MYVGRDFDPADEIESEIYTMDFIRDLADGEAIIGATWYCTVAEDSETPDDDASDHVAIPATYSGTKTMQHVSGLVAGVKYVLQAVIDTNQGNVKSLWSHVTCGDPV